MTGFKLDLEIKQAEGTTRANWYRLSVHNIKLFEGYEHELTIHQRELVREAIKAHGEAILDFAGRISK